MQNLANNVQFGDKEAYMAPLNKFLNESKPKLNNFLEEFRNQLIQGGHVATVRSSRGDDQMAACGQLGNPELSPKRPPLLYKK